VTKKLFGIIPLVLIVLLAFSLRWWHIASVTPGISGDEVDYALTAKSFYLSGTDLKNATHTFDVLRFVYPKTDDTKAELPYLIQMPFDGPFPFSLPLTRLPFVLMSVGSVLLLYGIAKELVDKKAGIAVGLLGSINPFLVVLGRTNYEVTGATFFYLFAFFALLKLKGWKILLALPIFLCAFYVYIGTKVLFIPFLLLCVACGYFYINKRKYAKQYGILLGILFIFFTGYFVILHATPTNRLGELLTPNSKEIIAQVNSIRHTSLPSAFTSFVVNKYTIYLRTVTNSLFLIFSSDFLVSYGDNFFRLYNHGVMYFVDIVFLLASVVFFAKKKQSLGLYVLGFILIATLPQILHDDAGNNTNYAHASLVFPFLIIASGIGIAYVVSLFPKKFILVPGVCLLALYALSLAFFMQAYFYQYSLDGRDDFVTRELARYIVLAQSQHKKIEVLSPIGATHFKKYLFYANALSAASMSKVKQAFIVSHMQLDNVSFGSCTNHPTFPKDIILIEDKICGNDDFMHHSSIALIKDGGAAYKIYNDVLCAHYTLKPYPTDLTLDELAVENLSTKDFCETFITRN